MCAVSTHKALLRSSASIVTVVTKGPHMLSPGVRRRCQLRLLFAVSYSFFGDRAPFLQHAAIAASMAVVRPLDSLADVDMVDVAWVFFVPRPSA